MKETGRDFDDVLAEAQALGYPYPITLPLTLARRGAGHATPTP